MARGQSPAADTFVIDETRGGGVSAAAICITRLCTKGAKETQHEPG